MLVLIWKGTVRKGEKQTTKVANNEIFNATRFSDCGWPTSIDNAVFNVTTNTLFAARVRYTCDAGYSMIGNSEIMCQGLGTWTTLPGCVLGKFYVISEDLLDVLASTLLYTGKMLQSPCWLGV